MFNPHCAAAVIYETFAVNPDGTEVRLHGAKRNLILDQGLNAVAGTAWANCFSYAAVGTGTRPTKRDSGTTTFTLAANVIAANANFFQADDVGRLFKFDSGEEVYITGVTDQTHAACVYAGTVASAQGTIWYVNDTGLQAEVNRTNKCVAGAANNGCSYNAGTYTLKRTFIFDAVAAAVTFNEIGWSSSGSAGNNLFGRDVISGGDSLSAGQQYKVVVRLLVTCSPVVATASPNLGGAFDTTGLYALENNGKDGHEGFIAHIRADGGSEGSGALEPSIGSPCALLGNFALSPDSDAGALGGEASGSPSPTASLSPYSNGTYTRKLTARWAIADYVGLVYGFTIKNSIYSGPRGLTLKFTNPQTKDGEHTLTFEAILTWGRILVN